ncbi:MULTISPECIES: L-2-hydroxyglutarate oxidase [unclassified Rhodococcus (in: high G+C Gram-positive bacteria)]|jgi:(S)-2-hydroxyglutarate dehydrogenase|uniref:L-2-hydroxyglutarate oxidase n=1 Tax=unclassified Rhodococcus (in: high G+C Gram-positive bacteria) TaxID=192944 RepID=UPI000BD3B665|nr:MULTISPECIES: L-2-hydroxyglutarate oxidase [unclassified Rhodococcus (in: high G+C Gram-positive bacteria)]PTR42827.1 L-2-hydroxyglutarate oxidase [Rhodococcus sp. OK611]SNX91816.1 L-2-hydroxyglutarate oxidase [Rhodococcus sp. OK270]
MFDYCVIGGGIVGVATAREILLRRPGASLLLLEKADGLGMHQTGHNSGVIHSGIYYQPGSLKAELSRRGAELTKNFAAEHGIPFDVRGKLLVATDSVEQVRMQALYERAKINGLDVDVLDRAELLRREPAVTGTGALFVPTTGIVDYRRVTEVLADHVRSSGGEIRLGVEVAHIGETADRVVVGGPAGSWSARRLVVCAGLQADRMARLAGVRIDLRIVPFRGEYYELPPHRSDLVHHLIYPIPDPALPFLGVHLSPTVDGRLTVGPNAVLGMAREGYRKFSFARRDVWDYAKFPGFYRVARANFRTGAGELRDSLFVRGYLARCRKYCPDLTLEDLLPRVAGIRAQAVLRDGTLVHDFLIEQTPRSVHVLNAPSPAATSALPIAAMIADRLTADR